MLPRVFVSLPVLGAPSFPVCRKGGGLRPRVWWCRRRGAVLLRPRRPNSASPRAHPSAAFALRRHRQGRLTLRTYKIEPAPLPKVDSKLIRDTRRRLRCSRAVFARKLRINERTLEKWEQGRAKPNPQAAALVLLVRKFPDTLDRLDHVAQR